MNYYCYSIKKGLFDDEMNYAKDLGIYIFYDEEKDTFFDKNGIELDIAGKKVFPRTGVYQAKTLVEAIIKHKGYPLVTNEDYEKTINWPHFIKTKRNNIMLSGKDILETPQKIEKILGNDQVFFKTKIKNFADIIDVSDFKNADSPFMKTIKEHIDEDFIISDVVDIEQDEYGLLEYRAFIINNEIMNISRVSDCLLSKVPNEILSELNNIIDKLKEAEFSKSYVIDLFIYKNNLGNTEVDILECNPIICSGTYLYNSVFFSQKDLIHECPSASLPNEKLKYSKRKYYSFNVIETRRPSICYNLPGGFAADLASNTLFGEKTSQGTFFHFAPSNICIPTFSSKEEIKTKKKKK